jgi:hypothetical protein
MHAYHRARTRLAVLAGTAAIAVAFVPAAGAAHPNGHLGGGSAGYPGQRDVEVVLTGLDSPRGLNFDHSGVLYIAEAGSGGDGPCIPGPEGDEVCLGSSGRITAYAGGEHWTIADGLPSSADAAQFAVTGPHDVAASPFGLIVPIGLGADPADRDALGPVGEAYGTVVRVNPVTGEWAPIVDLAAHEAANDPDAGRPGVEHPDSNPYGVAVRGTSVFVTDAGANAVLRFRQRPTAEPEISTLAVLPFQSAPAPPFVGLPPGTELPVQPVPTGIALHGGHYYVGQLTGFPFPNGAANVYRAKPGEDLTVYAGGFTNIIDIALDRKGNLFVLEMFTNGFLAAEDDPSGALWRVDRNGTRTLVADGSDGLLAPAGLAIARDGSIYVTNKAVFGAGEGEVLRIVP